MTTEETNHSERIDDLRRRAEEGRLNEARYLSIIEGQTELICRYAPDGKLSFVNSAYTQYYGKQPEELINTNFLPHIPESDMSMINRLLAGITSENPLVTYEHRIITPKGEVRWQHWTHRGIYNPAGELVEHQAVGHNTGQLRGAIELSREGGTRFCITFPGQSGQG